MSAVVSRRLTVTIQQSHDETIRAQLFTTFASYGTMETFICEDSTNYDQSVVTIQFQKLSASEQLQTDAVRSGRTWHVLFQQATLQASAELLVSSRRPLDGTLLASLAKALDPTLVTEAETAQEAPDGTNAVPASGALHSASASRKPRGATDFFQEKLLRAPGRATKDDDVWASFASRNVVAVQSGCVGPYVGLLQFKDAHSANAFLVANQKTLASQHDVYAQFVPPVASQPQPQPPPHGPRGSTGRVPPMSLHTAIHSLLTCQPVSKLKEGDALRGFIVEARSSAVCVVDAGVVDDTTTGHQKQPSTLLIETHTNFLKSRLRDEVLVQLRTVDAASRTVQATLLRTVNEELAVGSTGRLMANGRHGDKAARHQQQQLPPGVLPQQPFMNRPRPVPGSHSLGSTPTSSQDSLGLSQQSSSQASLPPAKKLASRLFQSIQQRKADGTLFTGTGATSLSAGSSGERISAFPHGLHPFSTLLVRVDRVETGGSNPGIHATSLSPGDGKTASGTSAGGLSVFIPASLIPSVEGEGWQTFAVSGERMSVALLYAVAVGDSRATLRCVASKLEADTRRAAALAAAATGLGGGGGSSNELSQRLSSSQITMGGEDNDSYEQTDSQQQRQACEGRRGAGVGSGGVVVGDTFAATPVRLLAAGDLGTTGTRGDFPGWVMLPDAGRAVGLLCVMPRSQAPPSLVAAAASMAAAGSGSALRALPPLDVVVSEIVHSGASGHYAVVMDAEAYRAAEERKQERARKEKEASLEQVKRRLAAVLGEDAVRAINTSVPEAKKPRTE